MPDEIHKLLQKIGLSDKEAAVYAASLALGPSTVQHIAAKALVTRPSTYLMVESLAKKGLMTVADRGKRRVFTAAPPRQLMRLLDDVKRNVAEMEETVKAVAASLENAAKPAQESIVRVYDAADAEDELARDIAAAAPTSVLAIRETDAMDTLLATLAATTRLTTVIDASAKTALTIYGTKIAAKSCDRLVIIDDADIAATIAAVCARERALEKIPS